MWILGIIAASIATALLIMLLKGGMRLVFKVVGTVVSSIFWAIVYVAGAVLSGALWLVGQVVKLGKALHVKLTTQETDVDEFTTYSWMKDSELRDQ
ncbi:hypothetical protein B8X04_17060 [Brevibacterium casei]|uniref:Uncharacterized protein n=1 Tax=Brevibacterium casei TaxID=33889 RepID=A0A269Z445_9MICO|nr:hypothetical protein [Brevibacterium casei]PAK92574.1 hypothetical protein B8X04_17060 [Brevibacterium casei]